MTNPYYISKYHCLQYPECECRIALERSRKLKSGLFIDTDTYGCIDDKVPEIACNVAYLEILEDEIKKCYEESDPTIANYIFNSYRRIVVNSFSHIVHLL